MAPAPLLVNRLAPAGFVGAGLFLLAAAGFIHRADTTAATPLELDLLTAAVFALWPLLAAEAVLGGLARSPAVPRHTARWRVLLVCVCPPARLGWVHPATGLIWLPGLGWQPPGKPLLKALEKGFGGPMLVAAFLILPVLAAEQYKPDVLQRSPGLTLLLHVGAGLIWAAFAAELVVKASAAPRTGRYFQVRWLDVVIVVLPVLEFALTHWVNVAPVARLLRVGRGLSAPQKQVGALNKAYRLRGLMMKAWQAFLLLEGVSRLTGHTPAKRLRKLEERIEAAEEALAELKAEAAALRARAGGGPAT